MPRRNRRPKRKVTPRTERFESQTRLREAAKLGRADHYELLARELVRAGRASTHVLDDSMHWIARQARDASAGDVR